METVCFRVSALAAPDHSQQSMLSSGLLRAEEELSSRPAPALTALTVDAPLYLLHVLAFCVGFGLGKGVSIPLKALEHMILCLS